MNDVLKDFFEIHCEDENHLDIDGFDEWLYSLADGVYGGFYEVPQECMVFDSAWCFGQDSPLS